MVLFCFILFFVLAFNCDFLGCFFFAATDKEWALLDGGVCSGTTERNEAVRLLAFIYSPLIVFIPSCFLLEIFVLYIYLKFETKAA